MRGRAARVWALARVFLAAHLPFLAPDLEDIDSLNFALGLRHFDPTRHWPHPPGYPLLIALGKLARMTAFSESHAESQDRRRLGLRIWKFELHEEESLPGQTQH